MSAAKRPSPAAGDLMAEVERLASIHHAECSLVKGSDTCDCQQNAGRVWLAKAYNGCSVRAEKAEARVKELEGMPAGQFIGSPDGQRCPSCGMRTVPLYEVKEWRERAEAAEGKLRVIQKEHDLTGKFLDGTADAAARLQAEYDKLKVHIAEHDSWCDYRKRLDLSFALGELSGAIQAGGKSGGETKRADGPGNFTPIAAAKPSGHVPIGSLKDSDARWCPRHHRFEAAAKPPALCIRCHKPSSRKHCKSCGTPLHKACEAKLFLEDRRRPK